MARPQQQELARSGHNALEHEGAPAGQPAPPTGPLDDAGPVPEANRPGHHPAREQDQPDVDDLAARLGITEPAPLPGHPLRTAALVGAGIAVAAGLAVTAVRLLRRRGSGTVARVEDLAGDLLDRGQAGITHRAGDAVAHVEARAADLLEHLAHRAPLVDR